eukprot:TRINITY_DN13319_c0_g1_i2.p1 TRINITY_DN13319_c0_g1~~TRINITY_DN13319_c0_g1_i2.p1  ORF type:complete len:907 (+),score=177.04 TRINITY_DN13319_c0_g1_i2:149-2869(+)
MVVADGGSGGGPGQDHWPVNPDMEVLDLSCADKNGKLMVQGQGPSRAESRVQTQSIAEDSFPPAGEQAKMLQLALDNLREATTERLNTFAQQLVEQTEACLNHYVEVGGQAEELIAAHAEADRRKDEAHRLMVAKLCAENSMLREKLAILTTTMPNLYQDMLLNGVGGGGAAVGNNRAAATAMMAQANAGSQSSPLAARTAGRGANRKLSRQGTLTMGGASGRNGKLKAAPKAAWGGEPNSPISPSSPMSPSPWGVTGAGPPGGAGQCMLKDAPAGEGGSWQAIVAWVPATLKTPEPWQPMSGDAMGALQRIGGVSPIENGKHPPGKAEHGVLHSPPGPAPLMGVLPHALEDDAGRMTSKGSALSKQSASDDQSKIEFELLDVWAATDKSPRRNSFSKGKEKRVNDETQSNFTMDEPQEFAMEAKPAWMHHPHARHKVVWDMLSILMVIYDMVMIPMSMFSLSSDDPFIMTMDWATRLFWTADVYWSCTTGVTLADGTVIFNIRFILIRYLKTWFALDMLIVGSDWLEFILSQATSGGGSGAIGTLSNYMRIVRVVRLLRLVRMREVLDMITERVQSDSLALIISNLKIVCFIVFFAHWTGCIWWGIGDKDSGATWVRESGYDREQVGAQYLLSLHWALSQLSGGMGEVSPANPGERAFVICHFIFAFMAAAIIVSILTAGLTQKNMISGHQAQSMSTLRKYLKQNTISNNLALRLQRSAQHAISGDLTADSVQLLQVVSEPLKVEMHYEMYGMLLQFHPFLRKFMEDCPQAMRRVCHEGMSMELLSHGDEIFADGEAPSPPRMYFIWRGQCLYLCEGAKGDGMLVQEKDALAEPALYTNWVHRGTLTCKGDVKLVMLDAAKYQTIALRYQRGCEIHPKKYAKDFVTYLNENADSVNDMVRYELKL